MNLNHKHTVLNINNLEIGFFSGKRPHAVARNIHFDLNLGELSAVVGANGIGKSTLLRTLARVQPALSGDITLKNEPLHTYTGIQLATEISVVLTEHIPAKNLTVIELIALGRQPYTNWVGTLSQVDKQKVNEAISLIGLETIKHKKCYELSDGQLQRVMIARALSQDTSIIILDEPTTHLDIYHKAYVLNLLKRIARETEKAILFSTHEIDMAIQLCDKILVLDTENSSFGEPCSLIEKGSFQHLFPGDLVSFDSNSGTFKINK
ncbi:ABC transporter ATP-binding protein [Galbibacter sp. CMA-7]|uniref:ABC transporter ATP-binding protein n=1 Tax=Galbibacter pacificus TaxID=2996052 RepID=A0ABT6FP20_9FLAO|nr:ABC transporter ATP-binding protein [Galbibacter pacificus]MDG3581530.1 ABC transporter ATP-binding protein [Galbibacter pacificus]MDG3585008.1 ABC transporter ATP-binding protein [Galbibacter pacificus]